MGEKNIITVIRFNLRKSLLLAFAALGPLGNLLTPHFLPNSFRTYYFLLPFFPLFFLHSRERIAKIGIILLPFFFYCFVSAYYAELFGEPNEPFPLFRFFLLFCQFFFILGAASSLRKREEIDEILKTYLNFYFISLAIGWLFYIGFYSGLVPFSAIERFSVLSQFGWGVLRFSPGSYPNEYGIVSSFVLSILTLNYLDKNRFNILFIPTFFAFLLTTTRAAFLSYFVCVIYLIWKSKSPSKNMVRISIISLVLFSAFALFDINMITILSSAFTQRINEGSLGERYFTWMETYKVAENHPYFGVGFGTLTNLHNVYLQLLFELGFVGIILLAGCLFIGWIEAYFKYSVYQRLILDESFHKVKMLGLINVLSFAASNHNINHHLTWFVFFLCIASLRLPYLEASDLNLRSSSSSDFTL